MTRRDRRDGRHRALGPWWRRALGPWWRRTLGPWWRRTPGPWWRRALRPWWRRAWRRCAPRSFALRGRPDDRELGWVGEELAARDLWRRGLRPLARRLRTPRGELDVVALDGAVLVVVEVKTGRLRADLAHGGRWRPGDRVRSAHLERLARAARWLARRRGAARWRVDVVEVRVAAAVRTRGRFSAGSIELRHRVGAARSGPRVVPARRPPGPWMEPP